MTYLNQAGTSWPKPEPVQRAVEAALREDPLDWPARFEAGHRAVARAFGVSDPARLLLTPGATSALSVAVADHDWRSGERVLTSELEHHALVRPLRKLAEQRGVELVHIPRASDAPIELAAVEAELRRGGVRMLAFTAACNVTGELLPLSELVQLAHAYDALVLVDAAQTAGWLPIDVARMEVDLLAFAGHKALHAPWGIGGLYVAPGVSMQTPAAVCELPSAGAAATCAPMPGYCDTGSLDRLALAGLEAALTWLGTPALADRLARARARAARLADGARELGFTLHGLEDPAARLPTAALGPRQGSPAELARELAARGVIAAAGLQCAPLAHAALGTAPEGVLRFSLGPLNEDEDVERALAALGGRR